MRSLLRLSTGLCAGALFIYPAAALANMGNTATTYGLLPTDIASAQALSMFNTQVSTTYYNPAYLAHSTKSELTAGLMHAEHNLKADSQQFGTYTVQDDPTQQVLLGLKADLSDLTELGQPMYLGVMIGSEKFGDELLAFGSRTDADGQYFNYGRQPLFLSIGVGTHIWRGLDIGIGTKVTLKSEASLVAQTNLAGETEYEELNVSAKPVIRPVISMNFDWEETFCPDAQCWYDGLETAFAFKGYSDSSVEVNANTIIPGTIPDPGLFIDIATVDSYQPNIYTLGMQLKRDKWRLGLAVEMQEWSALEDELNNDTVKNNLGLEFDDIVIPRIGAEYYLNDTFTLTGGVAFEESPLANDVNPEVNYLDADRTVIGLGVSATFDHVYGLVHPLRVDLGYQHHLMDQREFQIKSSQPTALNDDVVETAGDVNVFAGSISMQF
jgi:long-subunit fatty acid transport protein